MAIVEELLRTEENGAIVFVYKGKASTGLYVG